MRLFLVLLFIALLLLGGIFFWFIGEEKKELKKIHTFEKTEQAARVPVSPPIPLGYGRGNYYTPEIEIKPDLAFFYTSQKSVPLDHIGLKGVWFIERDRITSLSDDGLLTVHFQASRVFVELSGTSTLPVRIELDGSNIGEIWIHERREYQISLTDKVVKPHLLVLHMPRGISAYSFRFTE